MSLNTISAVSPTALARFPQGQQASSSRQHLDPTSSDTPAGGTLLQALLQAAEQDTFSPSGQTSPASPHHPENPWTASPQAVIQKIEKQQGIIPAGDIEDIIVSNFPVEDHRLASLLLEKMTRFASMKSLNELQGKLLNYSQKTNQNIYYEKEGSLGSTLNYLAKKYQSSQKNQFLQTLPSPFKNNALKKESLRNIEKGAILLDAVTIHQLAQSPALRQHILQHKLPLLYPQGWNEGINPFNQLSIEGTAVKLAQLANIAKQLQQEQRMSEDQSAARALSQPTRSLMTSWGLASQFRMLEPGLHPFNMENPPNYFPSSEKIMEQLAPASISQNELETLLKNFKEPLHQKGVLDVLAQQAEIFSPLRLSLTAQALHLKILEYAKKHHIPADRIFYHIPADGKSFGLISANHLMTNEVPLDQLIEDPADIKNPDDSLLIILDDVSGSGNSLLVAQESIRTKGFGGKIIVAPIISTPTAQTRIQELKDPNLEYLTEHQVETFKNHPSYQKLSPSFQQRLYQIIGGLGFDNNGLSIAFPYMAPDNNNAFFSSVIAPYFTLNRAGSKSWEFNYPLGDLGEALKDLFEENSDLNLDEFDGDTSDTDEDFSQDSVATESFGGLKKSPAQMNLATQSSQELMELAPPEEATPFAPSFSRNPGTSPEKGKDHSKA